MTKPARSLRVGIVLDDTLDRPDGVQQYVLAIGRWLTAQGHVVYYLVGHTTRTDVENVHSLSRTVKVAFNANVLAVPLPTSRRKVVRLLTELQLDVLHVQMPYSPLMAGKVIGRQRHEALVGTFHILPYGRLARGGSTVLAAMQKASLARFDGVMATSPASAEFARNAYKLDAEVVPNPVDVTHFAEGAKSARRSSARIRILFLGRLVERKGAFDLLRAIERLRTMGIRGIEVRIGGKGPLQGRLERYVADHDLGHIVTFDGFVSEKDKPAYLASADIAVFPALSGESFGIVLTEAMAAGAGVVLGGNNPGYRSVLGTWPECLLQADNTELFAHSLKTFIQNTTLRQRIHKQQQQAVRQYDVDVVGRQVLETYRRAILHRTKQVQ